MIKYFAMKDAIGKGDLCALVAIENKVSKIIAYKRNGILENAVVGEDYKEFRVQFPDIEWDKWCFIDADESCINQNFVRYKKYIKFERSE